MLPKTDDGKTTEAADLHVAIATLVSKLGSMEMAIRDIS